MHHSVTKWLCRVLGGQSCLGPWLLSNNSCVMLVWAGLLERLPKNRHAFSTHLDEFIKSKKTFTRFNGNYVPRSMDMTN